MCGIAACVFRKSEIDKKKFEAMTDVISYRGPDDRGFYYDNGLAMGHRRLSIIDLSKDGHQPFEMVDGYVIIFNGEIYNYIELREDLEKSGYKFVTKTDTEVIVQSYIKWGTECVSHFNGMWAFVIYDKKKRVLFCSRDRFGVKPFYYTEQEGLFLIASEIKQFFEVLERNPYADLDRLTRYIVRGDVSEPPYTMFKDVYQLEPGTNLTYDIESHSFSKFRYYSLDEKMDNSLPYNEACDLFRDTFIKSVSLRLRSDVQVGYFLSGGLDSSSIVCTADKLRRGSLQNDKRYEQHTITSCYEDKRYDEQEFVNAVVEVTDVKVHKVYPDTNNIWKDVDEILWHMDEPVFGASGVSQWSVCGEAAKQGLTVVLDGQGSDEQLAGYSDFYTVLYIDLLRKGKIRELKNEIVAYISAKEDKTNGLSLMSIITSAIKDWLTPELLDRYVKRMHYRYIAGLPFDKKTLRNVYRNIDVYPRRDPEKFIQKYMTDELIGILHNLDRKTMAFSLEARNPFLDYRLVEAVSKMPLEFKIRNGWTKAVLRDGMNGIIPEKVQWRKSKLAFVAPVEKWINENRLMYGEELKKSLNYLSGVIDVDRVMGWYAKKKTLSLRECNLVWRIIISGRWVNAFHIDNTL